MLADIICGVEPEVPKVPTTPKNLTLYIKPLTNQNIQKCLSKSETKLPLDAVTVPPPPVPPSVTVTATVTATVTVPARTDTLVGVGVANGNSM